MPISPESDYSLMGAVSCLHIAPDIYHGVFVSRLDVDAISDDTTHQTFGPVIEQAVLQWRETASVEQRFFMAVHGLQDIAMQVEEATGSIINTLARTHVQRLGLPVPRFELELIGPAIPIGISYNEAIDQEFIRRGFDRWAAKLGEQFHRTIEVMSAITDIDTSLASLPLIRYGSSEACTPAEAATLRSVRAGANQSKPSRKERRQVRRVINRGIKTYTKFFGGRDLQAFISRRETIIEGTRYNYWLRNHGNIVNHTKNSDRHGVPYGLTICTKQNEPLASACIFIPNTPIIDQILALALNVKDDDSEIEFLRAANLVFQTSELAESAELKQLAHRESTINISEVFPDALDLCTPGEAPDCQRGDREYYAALDRARQEFTAMRPYMERRICEVSQIPAEMFGLMLTERSPLLVRGFCELLPIVNEAEQIGLATEEPHRLLIAHAPGPFTSGRPPVESFADQHA